MAYSAYNASPQCAPPSARYFRRHGARGNYRRRAHATLGSCTAPNLTKLVTQGAVTVGAASAGAIAGAIGGAAAGAAVGAVAGPIGAVAGLLIGLFWPTTSACAKQSPDPETFLKCWSHPVPNDFIPEWNSSKCGWFTWVMCPGAQAGHYPAAGCGPCTPGPGYTCWEGTEIAPGVPAWGQAPADISATADSLTVAGLTVDPWLVVLGGGAALFLLRGFTK